ncbi:hypothetical protein [Streptomyces sp. NPDC058755]|uniref:hypothetical protein n=1 Tax=Streptomyces sp. NPDC058755 TaxID=3346624 RepID=UPI003677A8C2
MPIHFNNAGAGLMPEAVTQAMTGYLAEEAQGGAYAAEQRHADTLEHGVYETLAGAAEELTEARTGVGDDTAPPAEGGATVCPEATVLPPLTETLGQVHAASGPFQLAAVLSHAAASGRPSDSHC